MVNIIQSVDSKHVKMSHCQYIKILSEGWQQQESAARQRDLGKSYARVHVCSMPLNGQYSQETLNKRQVKI
jgi:hypothetical protein